MSAEGNPFPGPQPYRRADAEHFCGRQKLARRLSNAILSHRVLTVYGLSGAGKTSLIQAGVLPKLDSAHRVVTVDSWPPKQALRVGPVQLLVDAVCEQLRVAGDDLPEALAMASRRSSRPVLLVLDQLEQLLLYHGADAREGFVDALGALSEWSGSTLHVVLSLRDDYLGRWTALLRERPRLTRYTFQVPRLQVDEITDAVLAAARTGTPPQQWSEDALKPLIEEMAPDRREGEAPEVESAYAQIVCRALWAQGGPAAAGSGGAAQIMERYLEESLASLGALRRAATPLLEEKLITPSGHRRLLTQADAIESLGDEATALPILEILESARILRAQEHRGARFFELGHDWLAESIQKSAQARREAAARRRWLQLGAGVALAILGLLAAFLYERDLREGAVAAQADAEHQRDEAKKAKADAEHQRDEAEKARAGEEEQRIAAEAARAGEEEQRIAAETAKADAERQRDEAKAARAGEEEQRIAAEAARDDADRQRRVAMDQRRMQEAHYARSDPNAAAALLLEVEAPDDTPGWRAHALLLSQRLRYLAEARAPSAGDAFYDPVRDLFAAATDGGLWSSDGGSLYATAAPVSSIQLSDDGSFAAAVAGEEILAWSLDAGTGVGALRGDVGRVRAAALSPDGKHLIASGTDRRVLIWSLDTGAHQLLAEDIDAWAVGFHPRTGAPITGADDGAICAWVAWRGWRCDPGASMGRSVLWLEFDRAGALLAATAGERAVWLDADTLEIVRELPVKGRVRQMSISPDGEWTLAISEDGRGHLWGPENQKVEIPHGDIALARFGPDGRSLATADRGGDAYLWRFDPPRLSSRVGLSADAALVALDFLEADGAPALFTATAAGTLRLWPVRHGPFTPLEETRAAAPTALSFTADGEALIASYPDETLAWGLDGSRREVPGSASPSAGDAQSPDGRWRAAIGEDGAPALRYLDEPETPLEAHPGEAALLAFAPDSGLLAVAYRDGQIAVWPLPDTEALQSALKD